VASKRQGPISHRRTVQSEERNPILRRCKTSKLERKNTTIKQDI